MNQYQVPKPPIKLSQPITQRNIAPQRIGIGMNAKNKSLIAKDKLKGIFSKEIKRVNKDNAIYYFTGFTLIIILIIFGDWNCTTALIVRLGPAHSFIFIMSSKIS